MFPKLLSPAVVSFLLLTITITLTTTTTTTAGAAATAIRIPTSASEANIKTAKATPNTSSSSSSLSAAAAALPLSSSQSPSTIAVTTYSSSVAANSPAVAKAAAAATSTSSAFPSSLSSSSSSATATAAAEAEAAAAASLLLPVSGRSHYETRQTTTTSLLPLQPPLNVTSTTTSTFAQEQHRQQQQQQQQQQRLLQQHQRQPQQRKHQQQQQWQWQWQRQRQRQRQSKYSISDNVAVSTDSALSDVAVDVADVNADEGQRQEQQQEPKQQQQQQQLLQPQRQPRQQQRQTNGRHFVYGYFIGRANDSAFQQHNEMQQQTTGNKAGNYQVQLPSAEARTQVEYTADETGYHPVVRYESKNNTTMVSSHFALGQSTVEPLEPKENAPKLPNNTHGYLHFQFNYDENAQQRPHAHEEEKNQAEDRQDDVMTKEQSNAVTVNEVLSNLFPNGFADIFRFSYASEGAATTTPRTTPVYVITTEMERDLPTTTAFTPHSMIDNVPENKTTYSMAASVSTEYRRELSPGHTEIVVEKIALPASDEFKDGNNFITKDDLLRINRAAVDASVLPSLLMEPNNNNATKIDSSLKSNAPIIILNGDDTADIEEMTEEDNQIAESQYEGQVYRRLPENIKLLPFKESATGDFKTNAHGQNQQINVQIIQDESLLDIVNSASEPEEAAEQTANEINAKAIQIDDETRPREERASRELDNFQEIAERSFHQQNSVQEAPSRKFLKTFNPVLSEGITPGTLPPKTTFHYETQPQLQPRTSSDGNYADEFVPPAAQLQYQAHIQKQHRQNSNSESEIHESTPHPPSYPSSPPTRSNLVFVTLNAPANPAYSSTSFKSSTHSPPLQSSHTQEAGKTDSRSSSDSSKTPHEYVSEAAAEASQVLAQHSPRPKPYTFVEVQKSINIHNKLITEKDGRLLEEHETIYHQPQFAQSLDPSALEKRPNIVQKPITPHNYVSLSSNPINVQQLDYEADPQEGASHAAEQHVPPSAPSPLEQHQQHQDNVHLIPQAYPAKGAEHPQSQTYISEVEESKIVQAYPVKEIIEKIVDRPVPVEKIVERPVEVPYPVPVEHYIDRPYPVHEIIETHVPVPYPIPEPVPVAVPVDRYIDRPVPVETIVEKPVPYPVEKVVEKVVEKHVPVEVERIVEKPVEKVVNKIIDRPVPVPIHVPVAVPIPVHPNPSYAHQVHPHYLPTSQGHPNALPWPVHTRTPIPQKVMQNYYTRMLKKLLPQITAHTAQRGTSSSVLPTRTTTVGKTVTKSPSSQPVHPVQHAYRILDMRFDLKPPPPPPQLGPNWSTGARYTYNTLPQDLTAASALASLSQGNSNFASAPAPSGPSGTSGLSGPSGGGQSVVPYEAYDEFQRWRNGHNLKRSPSFGRNLQMEYGFKPPLVPSIEIDDKGMPLKAVSPKGEE